MINITKLKSGKEQIPKFLKVIVIVIIIGLIGAGAYFAAMRMGYVKTWQIARQLQKQQQVTAGDQKILSDLKKIIFLSEDVTPTMAIITDAESLKKQQPIFFNNAKNGDHLILYPDIAIIYNAETNKIMKVGPVQTAVPTTTFATSTPSN